MKDMGGAHFAVAPRSRARSRMRTPRSIWPTTRHAALHPTQAGDPLFAKIAVHATTTHNAMHAECADDACARTQRARCPTRAVYVPHTRALRARVA
jgi:hypothetical protein